MIDELSNEEVDRIIRAVTSTLHDHMQFYDENGQPANGKVMDEAESVLRANLQNTLALSED